MRGPKPLTALSTVYLVDQRLSLEKQVSDLRASLRESHEPDLDV